MIISNMSMHKPNSHNQQQQKLSLLVDIYSFEELVIDIIIIVKDLSNLDRRRLA